MQKILVSSCLLGEPVRYDGSSAPCEHPVLTRWLAERRIIPCCPEIAGGLGTPRAPVELIRGDGGALLEGRSQALGRDGQDTTLPFREGALAALSLCRCLDIRLAVLKERSPSCGSNWIHDGSFTGKLIPGEGVTTALLRRHGIEVFSEAQWELALERCSQFEGPPLSCPPTVFIE